MSEDNEARLLAFWTASAKHYQRYARAQDMREVEQDGDILSSSQISSQNGRSPGTSPAILKTCKLCSKEFRAARPDRVYCSRECQHKINAQRERTRTRNKRIAAGGQARRQYSLNIRGTIKAREFTDTLRSRCAKSAAARRASA